MFACTDSATLFNTFTALAETNHGLLSPILLHCVDDQRRPLLNLPRKSPETEQFRRTAYKEIPAAVQVPSLGWLELRVA